MKQYAELTPANSSQIITTNFPIDTLNVINPTASEVYVNLDATHTPTVDTCDFRCPAFTSTLLTVNKVRQIICVMADSLPSIVYPPTGPSIAADWNRPLSIQDRVTIVCVADEDNPLLSATPLQQAYPPQLISWLIPAGPLAVDQHYFFDVRYGASLLLSFVRDSVAMDTQTVTVSVGYSTNGKDWRSVLTHVLTAAAPFSRQIPLYGKYLHVQISSDAAGGKSASGRVYFTCLAYPVSDVAVAQLVAFDGTQNVNVLNTPSVNVANTPNVNVLNTPTVNVGNTPNVALTRQLYSTNGIAYDSPIYETSHDDYNTYNTPTGAFTVYLEYYIPAGYRAILRNLVCSFNENTTVGLMSINAYTARVGSPTKLVLTVLPRVQYEYCMHAMQLPLKAGDRVYFGVSNYTGATKNVTLGYSIDLFQG